MRSEVLALQQLQRPTGWALTLLDSLSIQFDGAGSSHRSIQPGAGYLLQGNLGTETRPLFRLLPCRVELVLLARTPVPVWGSAFSTGLGRAVEPAAHRVGSWARGGYSGGEDGCQIRQHASVLGALSDVSCMATLDAIRGPGWCSSLDERSRPKPLRNSAVNGLWEGKS